MNACSALVGRELEDDFDVVGMALQSRFPVRQGFSARDQSREPITVGLQEKFLGHLPVMAIGVDGAEDNLVFEHDSTIDRSNVDLDILVVRRDSRKAKNSIISHLSDGFYNHRRNSRAFDDYVGAKSEIL